MLVDEAKLEKADQIRYDGDYDAAIVLYEELLAESPDDPEIYKAYRGRGLAYQFNGLFDESIADLERMRELKSDFVKGCEDLFKSYLMLGMNDEAKAEMKRILTMDPTNEEVHKAIAYFPDWDD